MEPQQYGQPPQPPQYGAPIAGTPPPVGVPQYGAPPTQPQMGPPPEIKWSGLSVGGGHVPVVCFIGRLTDIVEDPRTYGLYLIERYDQVQILESPSPWPWATIDIPIKYSDKEGSGWGHHVTSAKALGLAQTAVNLAQAKAELIGKIYEMRQSEQSYGEDRITGATMKGDVWRFVRIVQPGMPQVLPQPQYAQPAGVVAVAPAPAPQPIAQVAQPIPVQQQQPQQAIAPEAIAPATVVPIPSTVVVVDLVPNPTDTPAVRAKKLLHGRALNEWLGVALMDEVIKVDSAFVGSIYDQSFILGAKASGQVVQSADGKFQVIA